MLGHTAHANTMTIKHPTFGRRDELRQDGQLGGKLRMGGNTAEQRYAQTSENDSGWGAILSVWKG